MSEKRSLPDWLIVAFIVAVTPVMAGDLRVKGDLNVVSNLTVGGVINVQSNRITNVADPTSGADAVNYRTMTNHLGAAGGGTGNFKADGSIPMTGALDMSANRIIRLADPAQDDDAVNKQYLWTSLTDIAPMGGLSMGIYTNRP